MKRDISEEPIEFSPVLTDPVTASDVPDVDDELVSRLMSHVVAETQTVGLGVEPSEARVLHTAKFGLERKSSRSRVLIAAAIVAIFGLVGVLTLGTDVPKAVALADSVVSTSALNSGRVSHVTTYTFGEEEAVATIDAMFVGDDEQLFSVEDDGLLPSDPDGSQGWTNVDSIEMRTVDGRTYMLVEDDWGLGWTGATSLPRQLGFRDQLEKIHVLAQEFVLCSTSTDTTSFCLRSADSELIQTLLLLTNPIESVGATTIRVDVDNSSRLIRSISLEGTMLQRDNSSLPEPSTWPVIDTFTVEIEIFDLGAPIVIETPQLGTGSGQVAPSSGGLQPVSPEEIYVMNALLPILPECYTDEIDWEAVVDEDEMSEMFSIDMTVEEIQQIALAAMEQGRDFGCVPNR